MLYDGLLAVQSEAGIDLNGGGERDVAPALALICDFERAGMARAVRWAADQAFPNSRKNRMSPAGAHWIALQRWADRIENGEVEVT
jgi:hypothetical protein